MSGNARILVADDDAMVRGIMRAVLARSGYSITEAVDGEDAVRQSLAESFDLLLLDHNMPKLSGWEAWAEIRHKKPDSKLLLLSGGLVPAAQEDGSRVRVLAKPFENRELVGIVGEMLANGHSQADGSK
jgi:CheY-like chemotaxis protein